MKTFKTRIYLNAKTIEYCKRAFGVRRCIWNWAIAASIEGRKVYTKRPSAFALDKSYRNFLKSKKDSCFEWLAAQQTTPRLMQEVLKDVDAAFHLACRKKGRNANVHFKTRKDRLQTFSGYCSDSGVFKLEGDFSFSFQASGRGNRGEGRTRESLAFLKNAKICKFTITCRAGEYWLCLSYEKPNQRKQKQLSGNLGIDLGVKVSACSFDGSNVENVSFNTKQSLKLERLAKAADSKLSKMQYGSNNYEKFLKVQQRRMLRAARARNEQLEVYSTKLVNTYEKIMVDDFTFKSAVKVSDHSEAYHCMKYQFKLRLMQKAAGTGCLVQFVPHQKGVKTTHKCSQCGSEHVHTNSQRQFHCLDCGYTADRDVNAARNAYNLI